MKFLADIFAWFFGLFVNRTRAAGAAEERAKINKANTERLVRQDAVAQKPVTDNELQQSLKDGSF